MPNKCLSSFVAAVVLILVCGSGLDLLAQRKVSAPRQSKRSIPAPAPPASNPAPQNGEPIGKRIIFTDGTTLDVDDSWKQGDTIWYRLHGTSQSLGRQVRSIETRFKEAASINKPTVAPKGAAAEPPAPVQVIWIYLADGARLRVDEVREVTDGAWYNRGNLTIFLDRERIARIEREQPKAAGGDWKEHGWSSGNASIDQLIRKNATRFGVDPYLVFLVIEQESHFNTGVVSPKGARGLMQLMPGTARRFGVSRPFDAAENIRGGTQYLRELMDMFGGQVNLVLASYNAGEGAVLKYGRNVPPYRETRDYVKTIGKRYGMSGRQPASDNDVPAPPR